MLCGLGEYSSNKRAIFSTVISLDHLLIDEVVLTARFACDVAKCKGACCTLPGGAGAPVLDTEVEALTKASDSARKYMSEKSIQYLDEHGPLEGRAGDWSTTCIDDKDCVFVVYENNIAVCSIEKAWHAGESEFRKPISCHLFPLRVADFGGPYVHYEQFAECAPGREFGEKNNISLLESAHDSLVRAYGEEIVEKLDALAKEMNSGSAT